jgi:hypothetical protein
MSKSIKTWKVSTNRKFFDYKKAQDDFTNYKNGKRIDPVIIYQSKGRCNMVAVPKVGDIVLFSCEKKKVLVGKVIKEFTMGTNHYNKETSNVAEHREPSTYATVEIISLGDDSEFRGVQRTWSQCKN